VYGVPWSGGAFPDKICGLVIRYPDGLDIPAVGDALTDFFIHERIGCVYQKLQWSFSFDLLHALLFYSENDRRRARAYMTAQFRIQRFAEVLVNNTQVGIVSFFDGANADVNTTFAKIGAEGFTRVYQRLEQATANRRPDQFEIIDIGELWDIAAFDPGFQFLPYWKHIIVRIAIIAGVIEKGQRIWEHNQTSYIHALTKDPRCNLFSVEEIERMDMLQGVFSTRPRPRFDYSVDEERVRQEQKLAVLSRYIADAPIVPQDAARTAVLDTPPRKVITTMRRPGSRGSPD
jgi:hypothetical protein